MLKCLADYEAGPVKYVAGSTLDGLGSEREEHLLNDAPGAFARWDSSVSEPGPDDAGIESETAPARSMPEPADDRMLHEAPQDKSMKPRRGRPPAASDSSYSDGLRALGFQKQGA